ALWKSLLKGAGQLVGGVVQHFMGSQGQPES
uniref:Dermaseptin-J10 n=1 Tax=Phasmahyla jandaia TaxID=762504 RepID=DMS10_PHAJA|nr:RecName: Full=Dermaseptin-J10; Short=DRS-J10 [Phasmahyla jandaia]